MSVCTEEDLLAALKTGGRIEFACSGTITLTKQLVIQQETALDAGTNRVVLTPQLTNRLFLIRSGAHLTLQGLTLRGGRVVGAAGADGAPGEDGRPGQSAYGAAVFNDGGFFTAIDTRFESHFAQGGDGGQGADGDAVQSRGRPGGRGGEARGGALYNNGRAELRRCVFEDNAVFGGAGGNGGDASPDLATALAGDGGDGGSAWGGAISCPPGAQLSLQDCSFARNTAGGEIAGSGGQGASGRSFPAQSGSAGGGYGGAVYGDATALSVNASTFQDNYAAGAGGWSGLNGLDARSGQDGFGGAAGNGGALTLAGGQGALTNCTLFANGAVGGEGGAGGAGGSADLGAGGGDGANGGHGIGGAIMVRDGAEILLVNCTFSLNEAAGGHGGEGGPPGTALHGRGDPGQPGRGLGGAVANAGATATLVNTILDSSAAEGNVYGTVEDAGHNISSDQSAVFTAPTSSNHVDPRVAWLADNGGSTLTSALLPDSPAIDRGDDTRCPPTDQRSRARVGVSDVGAFEFDPAGATPTLRFHTDANQLTLSWPSTLTGWRLQASEDPAAGVWVDVDNVQSEGTLLFYSLEVSRSQSLYFRLAR